MYVEERPHTPWTEGGPPSLQTCERDGRACRGTAGESNGDSAHCAWLPGPSVQTWTAPEAAQTMRTYRITAFSYCMTHTEPLSTPQEIKRSTHPKGNKNGVSVSQRSACHCGFSWKGRRPQAASIWCTTPPWCCHQSRRCPPPPAAPRTG